MLQFHTTRHRYHSHPGFGCWLSGVDVNTQQVGYIYVGREWEKRVQQMSYLYVLTHLGLLSHSSPPLLLHPNKKQSFEQLNQRAVAVVIDPIQSVKGKVVIDAFRTINPQLMLLNQEPRQTTSNIGHLNKPSIQALIHGLNRHYYSIVIDYRKNELEEQVRSKIF